MNKILSFLLCCAFLFSAQSAEMPLRRKLCLNGEWEYAFSKSAKLNSDAKFDKCRVPSVWGSSGHRTYEWNIDRSKAKTAFFKKDIVIPPDWKNRRIKLFFELLENANAVFINGTEVFRSPHMLVCHEIDITSHIMFGKKNTITVETGSGKWAGISRDVYLLTVPETRICHALVMPSFREKKLTVKLSADSMQKRQLTAEISVLDANNTVLKFAPKDFVVDKTAEITLTADWKDPVLWGFGKYGSNKLYMLKTVLKADGRIIDTKYDRFGFREFYTQGNKFMLNGKEIFLKGDLYHKTLDHTENPLAVTSYLKRMRGCNMNFLRHHSGYHLDNSVWFEIGDELGFLMEPEMKRTTPVNGKNIPADDPRNIEILTNYVKYNFNHPSIIMWCVDNESFSVGLTTPGNLRKINLEKLKSFNNLHTLMHKLDPTRITEINHNYSIYPFIRMKKFDKDNFKVFNIHPYGNLKSTIESEQRAVGFDGKVPVLVGEIYAHGKRIDFMRDKIGSFIEQKRRAESYRIQIASAASAKNVSGLVLCAQSGDGFCGYINRSSVHFGPWDDFAQIKKDGKLESLKQFHIVTRFPSLSGRGTKSNIQHGWASGGGMFGLNFNYSDKTVPEYRKTLIDETITESFQAVNGEKEPDLPEFRNPEVVVTVPENDKIIWCRSELTPEESYGVLSDRNGTGYFRLNPKENYHFEYDSKSKNFRVDNPAKLAPFSGYDHIFICEMGGTKEHVLRNLWKQPAEKRITEISSANQFAVNSNFEFFDNNFLPYYWKCHKAKVCNDANSGKHSLAISANGLAAQTFYIKFMQPGHSYRISGAVKKVRGDKTAQIQIMRSGNTPFTISAGKTQGKWEHFSSIYHSNGKEYALRCRNTDKSADALFLYDNIKVEKIPNRVQETLVKGPFELRKNGEICNMLILGPFPNPGNSETGWYAGKTDLLNANGGEKNAKPMFGKKHILKLDEASGFLPGEYPIQWKQLHCSDGKIIINNQSLEEAGISGTPPSHAAALTGCRIYSETDQDVIISIGSDDGYVLYFNGMEIGKSLICRGLIPDQEKYPVKLKKGFNTLLVKTIQESGKWEFMIKLHSPDRKPAQGIKIILPEEENLLTNGDFSKLDKENKIQQWKTNGRQTGEIRPAHKTVSLLLEGNLAQAVKRFKVKPGEKYRIEGWIKSGNSKKYGSIGVRHLNYKWILRLSNTTENWEHVSGEFTVPEKTSAIYIYCMNWYAGQKTKIYYADLKLVKVD